MGYLIGVISCLILAFSYSYLFKILFWRHSCLTQIIYWEIMQINKTINYLTNQLLVNWILNPKLEAHKM